MQDRRGGYSEGEVREGHTLTLAGAGGELGAWEGRPLHPGGPTGPRLLAAQPQHCEGCECPDLHPSTRSTDHCSKWTLR